MKIKFVELSMSGVFHTQVNSGMIFIFRLIYPDARIVVRTQKDHSAIVKEILNKQGVEGIKYAPLFYFPQATLRTIVSRDFLGMIYAIKSFFGTKKQDMLFFTNILPMTHWVIFLVNKVLKRTVYISIHGQAEAYVPGSSLRGTKTYFGFEKPIYKSDRRTRYVIFGDSIFKNISHIFSSGSKLIIIDHPYYYLKAVPPVPVEFKPLRIGQIGVGDYGKGTDLIFKLAELLRPEIESGALELEVIGKLNESLRSLDNGLVKWSREPLSNEQFEEKITTLHYSLFLRDEQCGRAVASGSFFDTIKFRKPFLSLPSDFVLHYQSEVPEIGTICSSIEDMAGVIRTMMADPDLQEKYSNGYQALAVMQSKLEIDKIAELFQNQIK